MKHLLFFLTTFCLLFAQTTKAQLTQTQTLDWDTFPGGTLIGNTTLAMSPGSLSLTTAATSLPSQTVNLFASYPNTSTGSTPVAYGNGNVLDLLTTSNTPSSITITFSKEVTNLRFTIFDLDQTELATLSAKNAAGVDQTFQLNALDSTATGSSVGIVNGTVTRPVNVTGVTNPTLAGAVGGWAFARNSARTAGVNVLVAGSVKTLVLTFPSATSSEGVYLSDIFVDLPVPDLAPVIYTLPSTQYGTTNFTAVVDVFELNNVATDGITSVYVSKDPLVALSFNPGSGLVGGKVVNNSIWTFNGSDPDFYIFTTNQVISAGSKKSFGLTGVLTPGNTQGTLTITSTIVGGSGSELKVTNNSDADKIDYFNK